MANDDLSTQRLVRHYKFISDPISTNADRVNECFDRFKNESNRFASQAFATQLQLQSQLSNSKSNP